MTTSDYIDLKINEAIQKHKRPPYKPVENPFESLLSLGELVDRLSIVNYKLYDLKNEVMKRQGDTNFLAGASIKDVALVEERSRLKKCIDQKVIAMIENPKFNPEIKSYGKAFND